MKEITLKEDYGEAKKGIIYVKGLHETPDFYKNTNCKDDFYWEKGSKREDNRFLMSCTIE